jgi:cobalt-zinc-cadmium resistance protein CzcA
VVEINTWGGYLKQYEATPSKLKALNISTDVLRRLRIIMVLLAVHISKKVNQSFLSVQKEKSLDDIENIVVKNRNGTPIYV